MQHRFSPGLYPLPEEGVICPVRDPAADGGNSNPVDQKHDPGKNRQGQETVSQNTVDFLRCAEALFGAIFGDGPSDKFLNVGVALVGNDGFGVVVHFLFAVTDVFFQMRPDFFRKIQLLHHFFVAFKNFYSKPAQVFPVDLIFDGFFNMGESMFDRAAEHMRFFCLFNTLRGCNGGIGNRKGRISFKRTHGNDFAAQLFFKHGKVNFIAILPDHIHHVDGNDRGNAGFQELGCQIEVAFDIRAIDDVDDGIWFFFNQVVS